MTNKDELWAAISAPNPSFNGEGNVTLSAKGLRKLFDLVYDNGFEQGQKTQKAFADMKARVIVPDNPNRPPDPFEGLRDLFKEEK